MTGSSWTADDRPAVDRSNPASRVRCDGVSGGALLTTRRTCPLKSASTDAGTSLQGWSLGRPRGRPRLARACAWGRFGVLDVRADDLVNYVNLV